MYKELLQVLGVGVSEAKTHSSLHFYEFAKRIFLDELEISPFPVSAIFECGKSSVMMTTLLNTLLDKGWVFTDIPSSVGIFYGVLRQRSSSFKKEVRNMSYLFEGVLKTIQAKIPITEFINELCKKYNWPSHLGEEACKSILNQIALKSFLKTNKIDLTLFDPILDVPLGALSTRIVSEWPMFIKKYYNGNIPHHIATFQPTFDLPLLWAFKKTSNMYSNMSEKLRLAMDEGLDWSTNLKTFCLPRDDKSIIDRNDFLLSRTVLVYSSLLENYIKECSDMEMIMYSFMSDDIIEFETFDDENFQKGP